MTLSLDDVKRVLNAAQTVNRDATVYAHMQLACESHTIEALCLFMLETYHA